MAKKNIQVLGPYIVSAGLLVLFFGAVLTGERTFYFRDIHRWFYPMKYFLAASFQHGELPFWCSRYFCGAPFASDIQSGVFYPLSLVFVGLPFPLSFNLYIAAHFFLGFFFCYRFLLQTGRSCKTAIFGATAFCYGGYLLSSINTLNNLSTAIWLPAVLWRCQLSLNGHDTLKNRLVTILFLAMAILGGEPQLFIMIAGLAFIYTVSVAQGSSWRKRLRLSGIFPILAFAAVLVTMVQLGPTYLDYRLSMRAGGLPYDMATKHSLSIAALEHLVVPLRFPPDFATRPETLGNFFPDNGNVPWLLTIYPGFLIVPLSLASLFWGASKKGRFWLAIFFVSTLLALGSNTPAYYPVYKLLPFFRFPEKFMFLSGFSLAVMAATGLDHLLNRLKSQKINTRLVFSLLLLSLIADLYSAHRHLNPTCEPDFYQSSHPDLAPIFKDPGVFRVYVDPAATTPDDGHNRVVNYHARWQLIQMPHLGIITGIDHVDGKTGMQLQYQYLIHEMLTRSWAEKIGLLRIANVKYIVSDKPLERIDILADRIEKLTPILYRLKDSLPRAVMIGKTAPPSDFSIQELAAGAFDPARTVLVKENGGALHDVPSFQDIDAIRYDGSGKIDIQITAKHPALLFLSESYYPGWQVTVDGQPREVLRADLLYQGVAVEPGRHDIEFSYRTPHFNAFSAISLVAVLSLAIIYFRKRTD